MPRKTLERKIYFYRSYIGSDDSGYPLAFDPSPALRVIDTLPFTDTHNGRYESDSDDGVLCVITTPTGLNKTLRFCRIRRSGLPQLEQQGNISELQIAANAGLLEPIHIVFFPKNIIGVEYNHYGPRLSRLAPYLYTKSNYAIPKVSFNPILRRDIAEQLDQLVDIRLLELQILPSYTNIVRQIDDSLADALESNGRITDSPDVLKIVAKSSRQGRETSVDKLISPLKNLSLRGDLRENATHFKVRGKRKDTRRVETIDLLKDHLISTKRITCVTDRGRALRYDSAFQAIHEAYDDLIGELESAPSISYDSSA